MSYRHVRINGHLYVYMYKQIQWYIIIIIGGRVKSPLALSVKSHPRAWAHPIWKKTPLKYETCMGTPCTWTFYNKHVL